MWALLDPDSLAVSTTRAARPAHSHIDIAKAKRARPRRRGEGRAHPGANGPDGAWTIKTAGDVARSVREVELGRARGPKEAAIKAWIVKRAGELGVSGMVPKTDWSAARSRRARQAVHTPEDEPRYTDEEIQKLGEENPPRALKRANGKGFHYPIVDGRDVTNAVAAYGRAKPSERAGVRAWIVKRARELRVESRLPASDPGLERANLRALLGVRCEAAAVQDLDYLRRVGELPADHPLGAQVLLQSECEAVVEVADELERMMAGGEA